MNLLCYQKLQLNILFLFKKNYFNKLNGENKVEINIKYHERTN